MKNWQEEYKRKLISAPEAANFVKSGDLVVFTVGREAHSVGLAIAARKDELKDVKVSMPSPGYDFGWYDPGWEESFEVTVSMPTAVSQQMVDERRCDLSFGTVIPFAKDLEERSDILITEVSPPDERGFCSFGASVWNKRREIKEAKLTIAEVNKNLIRTFGENYVHISEIDYFVEHVFSGGTPGMGTLAGRVLKKPEPYVKRITENVSTLIKDGDTIQIGVGRTTEPMVSLGLFDGKRVATSIGGSSREEMEWVNENPLFLLVDVTYLEDIRIIAAHDNMVVINNALAVDLMGQITAETLGTKSLSVAGGQIPFVLGAWLSNGGRAITVLPSTARDGTVSRIMPALPLGTAVTIQRNCADFIVTEYGVAKLRGKSARKRAEELISVAHPDFRAELRKEAQKLYWP
jgi:4-hydroxybutyrate CoA-transferase